MATAKPDKSKKPVDPVLERRRSNFGKLIGRGLDAARSRGMSIADIEAATNAGSSTLYGWRDGRWTRDPVASLVNSVCEGLGISRTEAYRALEWDRPERSHPEPITDDPLPRNLMKILNDPKVSPTDKLRIRRLITAVLIEHGGDTTDPNVEPTKE